MASLSTECQSLHIQISSDLLSTFNKTSSVFSAFFKKSNSQNYYDLTALSQTCFSCTRIISVQQRKTNGTSISLPPLINEIPSGKLTCLNIVPSDGNCITSKTKVTVEFIDASSHEQQSENCQIILQNIENECPWLSSLMTASLRSFLISFFSPKNEKMNKKNGIVVAGPPRSGRTHLANTIAKQFSSDSGIFRFDCFSFAELCVLHEEDFNIQEAIRNELNQWLSSINNKHPVLILENLDIFDNGGSIRVPTTSSSSSAIHF